jgi:hypothetical protein
MNGPGCGGVSPVGEPVDQEDPPDTAWGGATLATGAAGAGLVAVDDPAAELLLLAWCFERAAARGWAGMDVAADPLAAALADPLLVVGVGLGAAGVRALAAACVEPGRMNATAPAVTTPARPTVTVAVRSWSWLRWRRATAARTSRWRLSIRCPILSRGLPTAGSSLTRLLASGG